MKSRIYLVLLPVFLVVQCTTSDDFPVLKGPYFGKTSPGMTAEAFDPGIFFEDEGQGCSGFLNDGTVFIFTSQKHGSDWRLRPTYISELKNGRWTRPYVAPFSKYAPYNFTVGPDGRTLYFTTLKSLDKTTSMFGEEANIWAVMLGIEGWSEPVMFGRSINTEKYYENYPAVTMDKTIYYMSRREVGVGGTDVWRSRNIDGKYAPAENVELPVNTTGGDADPFVAPDESYLIVCQDMENGFGEFDLYIYFQKEDGSWSNAINMGVDVNSSDYEFRPYVTPDGKYLFFTSNRPTEGNSNIFWVDAAVIQTLKPDELK